MKTLDEFPLSAVTQFNLLRLVFRSVQFISIIIIEKQNVEKFPNICSLFFHLFFSRSLDSSFHIVVVERNNSKKKRVNMLRNHRVSSFIDVICRYCLGHAILLVHFVNNLGKSIQRE